MKESFGQRLRRLMTEKGYNQTTLAAKTGIDRSELNRTVNDKRRPRPEEIGWLAQALRVTPAELLDGVKMSPAQRQAVERFEELARRVLVAEGERDETVARMKVCEKELERRREELEEERETLRASSDAAQRQADQRIQDTVAEAQQAQRQLWDQLRVARNKVNELTSQLEQTAAINKALKRQVTELQEDVSRVKESRVVTGLLAAFAGAALSSGSNNDEEDG